TVDGRSDGPPVEGRREFLAALGGMLYLSARPPVRPAAQESLPGTGPSGKLFAPEWAGRPQQPITARDVDAGIQAIEKRLHCTCGCNLDVYTCRTTDFTCAVSPEMHRQVLALADRGMSADEIVNDFVERHGVAILMAPPARGFNLAGYLVPSIVILVAAAVLFVVLRRWTRARPAAAGASGAPLDASPDELERLQRELTRLPD
ncbi:MAG: cytochrome c-type biogenesis protein, partial [Acidimicrobiales bacterium]